jgi:hypothetical protein
MGRVSPGGSDVDSCTPILGDNVAIVFSIEAESIWFGGDITPDLETGEICERDIILGDTWTDLARGETGFQSRAIVVIGGEGVGSEAAGA